mmetsp:Transcript_5325/g.15767  ORF Transcript_5325/g.15767 Transcript_5325/m.15767 type:complete len:294 (+) Transcript_5325:343-1224(+)
MGEAQVLHELLRGAVGQVHQGALHRVHLHRLLGPPRAHAVLGHAASLRRAPELAGAAGREVDQHGAHRPRLALGAVGRVLHLQERRALGGLRVQQGVDLPELRGVQPIGVRLGGHFRRRPGCRRAPRQGHLPATQVELHSLGPGPGGGVEEPLHVLRELAEELGAREHVRVARLDLPKLEALGVLPEPDHVQGLAPPVPQGGDCAELCGELLDRPLFHVREDRVPVLLPHEHKLGLHEAAALYQLVELILGGVGDSLQKQVARVQAREPRQQALVALHLELLRQLLPRRRPAG